MRRRLRFLAAVFLAAGAGWLAWRHLLRPAEVEVQASRYLMGTELTARVKVRSRAKGLAALKAAFDEVARLEALLSSWRPDSEISRLSAEGSERAVPLSPPTVRLLHTAFHVAEESHGAFHPALGGLLEAWGFYAQEKPENWRPPSRWRVYHLRQEAAWDAVHLIRKGEEWEGRMARPGPRIDLGGIAKGFALDEAAKKLREAGVWEGVLNFGGNVRLMAPPGGGRVFEVPLRAPTGNPMDLWETLFVPRGSISVSGNYEKFREWNGKRYGHVLDPRTGFPVEGEGCVVVWAPSATLADAWSTALWVLGPETGLPLAQEKGFEAMFLVEGKEGEWVERKTPGFEVFQKR